MCNRELKILFALVRRVDDRVLYEISTVPQHLLADYKDRVIVAVARGEREWRNTE